MASSSSDVTVTDKETGNEATQKQQEIIAEFRRRKSELDAVEQTISKLTVLLDEHR